MGLLSFLFNKKKKAGKVNNNREEFFKSASTADEEYNEDYKKTRYDLSFDNYRLSYIEDCLIKMSDATSQIDELNLEYSDVTLHLNDIEELDRLPIEERQKIDNVAKRIVTLNREKKGSGKKKVVLTRAQFTTMQKFEGQMPGAYEKLAEAEDYQEKILSDLKRVNGEKNAYEYRKDEIDNSMENARSMAFVCVVSLIVCVGILLVFQIVLELEVMVGYIIAILAFIIAMMTLYIKFSSYKKDRRKIIATTNKIILLQNKVKIRYINNTRLLDYLYVKYACSSAKSLETLWKRYQDEMIEAERNAIINDELKMLNNQMIRLLDNCPIEDKHIWLLQPEALVDPKEMVEIRHYYNTRRQKLRKQMQYNNDIAKAKQEEITDIVKRYPESAEEILKLVARYESL